MIFILSLTFLLLHAASLLHYSFIEAMFFWAAFPKPLGWYRAAQKKLMKKTTNALFCVSEALTRSQNVTSQEVMYYEKRTSYNKPTS